MRKMLSVPKYFIPLTIDVPQNDSGLDLRQLEKQLTKEVEESLEDHEVLKKEEI